MNRMLWMTPRSPVFRILSWWLACLPRHVCGELKEKKKTWSRSRMLRLQPFSLSKRTLFKYDSCDNGRVTRMPNILQLSHACLDYQVYLLRRFSQRRFGQRQGCIGHFAEVSDREAGRFCYESHQKRLEMGTALDF
ncbi:hypothetical protein RvY_18456-2 [Ramazzottius varieornatus]|uniref:Secreted protein n=1 Tax=Ramazzottius varieornatus TaxID=947166 RepID=A0A1D1W936_RAMVA|nr:hypothetical protein RvY_18456-2 [Ramazzottius varieornatus]